MRAMLNPKLASTEYRLAMLPPDERQQVLAELDMEMLAFSWDFRGRPDQLEVTYSDAAMTLYSIGRGGGKRLDIGTLVPTPSGWTTMGALTPGDRVLSADGKPCRVIEAHPIVFGRKSYELTFDDGSLVVADDEHLWFTWDKTARKAHGRSPYPTSHPRTRTTAEIRATLRTSNGRETNHSIANTRSVDLPAADLPIDPWVFGLWLGDGTNGSLCLGDDDAKWVLAELHARGYVIGAASQQRSYYTGESSRAKLYGVRGLLVRLRECGALANKRVPPEYLRGSEQQRRDLLAGMLDSDGYVDHKGQVSFTNVRRHLSDAVFELAASLGYKPTMRTKMVRPSSTWNAAHKEFGPFYIVAFSPREQVFKSRRAAAGSGESGLVNPDSVLALDSWSLGQANRTKHRYIVDVREVPSRPMRCITVDSADHLYLVGRGFIPTHNTFTGAQWIRHKIHTKPAHIPKLRFAFVARTAADVRDVMVNGESGIMSVFPPSERPEYISSQRLVKFHDGSEAMMVSSIEPALLRGPGYHNGWADELAAWKHIPDDSGVTAWENLQIATRLGDCPQVLATSTPKRTREIRKLYALAEAGKVKLVTGASTYDNPHLVQAYMDTLTGLYEGTRLEEQEMFAVLAADVDGALWRLAAIEDDRIQTENLLSIGKLPLRVVGVDPSVSEKPKDECGIVIAGATAHPNPLKRHAYVLDDYSLLGPPSEWAAKAVQAAKDWDAPIVAEVNNGGALVKEVIHGIDPTVRVTMVHAKESKKLRAEPVTLAYDQHRVHHMGELPLLEDQMTTWEPGVTKDSPDRIDALVYALTALVVPSSYKAGISQGRAKAARGRLPGASLHGPAGLLLPR